MAFSHHEPCPNCGSRDNLACYDDGSQWCFGCRYYQPPAGLARVNNYFRQLKEQEYNPNSVSLPDDVTFRLEQKHIDWLHKYGISRGEIINYRIMSSKSEGLILPIFNSKQELLFYVNRPMQEGKPKSLSHGKKPFVVFKSRTHSEVSQGTCFVVEDYISAIKVSRQFSSVPLFGSYLGVDALTKLSKRFSRCVLWLDRDKAKESLRQALRWSPYFKQGCVPLVTDLDPKEYSDKEILDYGNSKVVFRSE